MKVAIIASMFNKEISNNLIEGAISCYKEHFDNSKEYLIYQVPGAFEIPPFIKQVLLKNIEKLDAIITLGSIIKGETAHFEYISSAVSQGVMKISLENSDNIPILFGVLTTYNKEQALNRSKLGKTNKGYEVMNAAIEMVDSINKLK